MRNIFTGLLVAASVLLAGITNAEEDDLLSLYDEEELISIATGTAKQVRFAPSVATVITEQDIRDSGARMLDEVLEMVPGLHVAAGSNRLNSIYSIRGIHTAENPQVLLLIDGVDTSQLFTGARPFNFRMPVANISRVEVIRGPGSAVYGADAFSGVINVITKKRGKDGVVVGGRAGSFDSQDGWLLAGTQFGSGLNLDFALEYSRSDGDNQRNVDVDAGSTFAGGIGVGQTNAPGSLDTDYELFNSRLGFGGESWQLSVHSWNLVSAGLGSGGAEALDPIGKDESESVTAQYTHNIDIADDWKLQINLSANYLNQDPSFILFPAGSVVPGIGAFVDGVIGRPHSQEIKTAEEIAVYYEGFSDHRLRAAVGYEHQEIELSEVKNFDFAGGIVPGTLTDVTGTNLIFLQDQTREAYYVSLQDEWHISDDWEFTLGVRFDEYNDFGSTVNPRAALVWAANYNLTLKALYGRAFRAPSFAELFAANNPVLVGNSNLDPEIIDTFEIAMDYRLRSNLSTKLNVFYYEIDDLIDSPFGMPSQNSLSQYGFGLESEISWDVLETWSLDANFAWQNAEQGGVDVSNAPGYQAYLRSSWKPAGGWVVNAVVNFVASRERAAGDMRSNIDDFVTTDFVLRKNGIADALDVGLVLKNAFNEDVREPSDGQIPNDYPMEGRSVRLELTYSYH